MVWSREIVAERFRAVVTEEHGTRVLHIGEVPFRLPHAQLQMLRREVVCKVDRTQQIAGNDDLAVVFDGSARDCFPRERAELPFHLRADRVRNLLAVCDQHRGGKRVMLRLT